MPPIIQPDKRDLTVINPLLITPLTMIPLSSLPFPVALPKGKDHSFKRESEWSIACHQFNLNFVMARRPGKKVMPGTFAQDKKGGDFIAFLDELFKIKEPWDIKNYKLALNGTLKNLDRVFLEIHSKKEQEVPGWAVDFDKITKILSIRWANGQYINCDFPILRELVSTNWKVWVQNKLCVLEPEQGHSKEGYISQTISMPLKMFITLMSPYPNFETGVEFDQEYYNMAVDYMKRERERIKNET